MRRARERAFGTDLPYESCRYYARNRYERTGHVETMCLEGSTDQEIVLVREPNEPNTVTVRAQVLVDVAVCGGTTETAYGVQVGQVD